MSFYFFIFTQIFFIIFLSHLATKIKLVDIPNERKIHTGKIPVIGGLAIFLNLLLFILFFNASQELYLIFCSAFFVLIVGIIDDIFDLGIFVRIVSHFIASFVIISVLGLFVVDIGDYSFFETPYIKWFSIFFTILAVVGLTNSFNFIDGINGLCASSVIISIVSIIMYSYIFSNYKDFQFPVILIISLIIFVFFNLGFIKKYQIFLGDGGSTFLGFLVAWLLIYYSQHPVKVLNPVLTIWCVSLPIFDFMSVFLRRINNRKNPFKPDRNHMHHLLLKLGYSSNISLLILILFSIIFTIIGGMLFSYFGPTLALMIFLLFLIIYVLISNYLYKLSLNLNN